MSDVRIVVAGAAGRMGLNLIRAVAAAAGARLTGALEAHNQPHLGEDAGTLAGLPALGVAIVADAGAALAGADVLIDFTGPKVSVALARAAANAGVADVIGTTGFATADEAAIAAAAQEIAIVKSGNMSLGVCLLSALVRKAAATLPDFDVEILEMHHAKKADAPSGTALMLGRAAAAGRGVALEAHSARGRDGLTGPRKAGDIGFASLRGGTVVGEHSVVFAGERERIVLSHTAEDRAIFAGGAVKAALWTQGKPAGLYGIADVLGLKD
jgi:4-hydroxy-tetrahydrodipicolinate reductase